MGAPTSSHKRVGLLSNSKNLLSPSSPFDYDSSSGLHAAKRFKSSHLRMSPDPDRRESQPNAFDRVQQYPPVSEPIKRSVHAPGRSFKPLVKLGNSFRKSKKLEELDKAKKSAFGTFGAFKYAKQDDEIVDVDRECSNSKAVVLDLDDSSDGELQVLDWNVDGGVQRDQKSVETKEDAYVKEAYRNFAEDGYRGSSSMVSDLSNQTPKEEDDDCAIISVSPGGLTETPHKRELTEPPHKWELTEPVHKTLYAETELRTSKINHLDFLIQCTKIKLSGFRQSFKSPKQDSRTLKEPFVELTDDEEAEVSRALSNPSRRKLLVTHADSNIEITGQVLQCLRPGAWLNDEVINLYLELLKEREKREPQKFLKCHFFNTFFYKKLISGKGGYDFKAVRRWTTQRKIGYGLADCDKIFVPIHKEIHWCLGIINKKDKKFQYLDSLKGRDSRVLQVLARYYVDEVKDKSAKDIDVSSWEQEYVDDLPAQENGFDCGMFMIKYADFYSRGLGLAFGQNHMPYFRKRTAKEILRLKAE